MESTRLPSDLLLDEAQRRDRQRRNARGNLAALVVEERGGLAECRRSKATRTAAAAEFAELADMLGLSKISDRAPGTCGVCGREMPASWTTRVDSKQVRRDVCARKACKEAARG